MNTVMSINNKLTMTSIEIAELVESQHGNVRTSIERLAKRGVIQLPAMQKVENKQSLSPNKLTNVYIFEGEQGKRDSIVVVAQLSPEFTARLVDRWQELESQVSKPVLPQNYIEALEALLTSEKEKERLALENKEMAPKAEVYDRIVDRNNLYNATQVAQKFGQSAVWMNKQLEQFGVYNRSVKRGRVFQQWFIDKGYGIMRETETGHSQAMFYAEGEMWIIGKLTEEGLI